MKTVKVVAAIICDSMENKNKIFATARGYGDQKGGWEFPGGKIEPGETPQEALVREIKEELDTLIKVGDLLETVEYDYPTFHLSMDCFWCEVLAGDLVLKEAEDARWLAADELDSVAWLPADQGLIENIKKKMCKKIWFEYGEEEISYLKKKDKKLAMVIDKIGHINRECEDDLFLCIVHSIIAQQVSKKAELTVWKRLVDKLGEVTPETIHMVSAEEIQALGTTFKKADYIKDFAEKILSGEFDIDALADMSDQEAIKALSSLKGIGVWTAEMMLIHCLQRKDILSFGDLAVIRGMKMVYHHKDMPKARFERYRKRFSPYGTVACIYFWAVSAMSEQEFDESILGHMSY